MTYPRTIAIPHGPTIELESADAAGVHWRCEAGSGVATAHEHATADEAAIYAATFVYVRAQLLKIYGDNELVASERIAELEAELARR